jgi:2,5-diketo-D-gluconate reductase B
LRCRDSCRCETAAKARRQPHTAMMTVTLKSGATMPVLGLGTWQLNGEECVEAVSKAIALGYRHIDTAEAYENHREVKAGIMKSGVHRQDLFITSKLMRGRYSRRNVLEACDATLKELGVDYLDLYLIHWPDSSYPVDETLDAMGGLIAAGKVRDIGVSNFTVSHIREAEKASRTPVSVNQVEYHVYLNQESLLSECTARGIVLTAYSPLARGQVIGDQVLIGIGERHGKTASQVAIRWLIQKGITVIPKAKSEAHLRENLDVFDFELTSQDMHEIDSIGITRRLIKPPWAEFDRA